jgi:hypothetical protein
MQQLFGYYGRYQSMRGGWLGLPGWARFVLLVLALPGILAVALSIAAVLCSLAALLLLTVPAYRLLKVVTDRPESYSPAVGQAMTDGPVAESHGRRHVDVKIIE